MVSSKRALTNTQMCDIVILRARNRLRDDRIKELEKYLNRAMREIETLQAQVGDNQSNQLLDRMKEVLETPIKEVY